MPKVLVSRWRRKKPVYLSSPVKVRAADVEPTAHLNDVVVPVSANLEMSENAFGLGQTKYSIHKIVEVGEWFDKFGPKLALMCVKNSVHLEAEKYM